MHVSRIATVLLIATLIAIPAVHIFREAELGSPPPSFEVGLWWGPQISHLTPTSAQIDVATLQHVSCSIELTSPLGVVTRTPASERGTRHVFALTGLSASGASEAASTYTYRVFQGEVAGQRRYAFRLPPAAPDAPVRFVALGDTGSGSPRQLALIDRIAQVAPEFVVITGDLAYPHGTVAQVRARFTIPWSRIHPSTPILATLGNHDVQSDGIPVLDVISLPTSEEGGETFYRSRHRSVELFCINAEEDMPPTSTQYAWLDRALRESTAPWKIVFGHRAVYSGSRSGGDKRMQDQLVPLLEHHRVDLYLSGHDHVYMRTFPMTNHQPTAKDQEPDYRAGQGPIHIVTGGGGKSLYAIHPQPHLAEAKSVDHIVSFEVTPTRLVGRVLGPDGAQLDTFSVEK